MGRSGRFQKGGEAVIQTVSPDHSVIQTAARQDYFAFYEEEILLRKTSLLPPFCDIAKISFSGAKEEEVKQAAENLYRDLYHRFSSRNDFPVVLYPVTRPVIYRLNGKFRYRILLKCKNTKRFRALLRESIIGAFSGNKMKHCTVTVDFNGEIN